MHIPKGVNGGKAIICLNSDLEPIDVLKTEIESCSMVFACDGAFDRLNEIGISANIVIGDFDSTSQTNLASAMFIDKDEHRNDFEKALSFAQEKGYTEIVVFGVRGGDIQHEFSNYLIMFAHPLFMRAHTPDSTILRMLPHRKYSICIHPGAQFSLFTSHVANGINLHGSKYPLSNASLTIGSQGLHNIATNDVIQIEYSDGCLLFVGPENILCEYS
jgi:thiamine pyrophosphokinase